MKHRRILLVEDNPADIRLTQEVLRESNLAIDMDVVRDGEQALAFLRRRESYTVFETVSQWACPALWPA